MKVNTIIIAAAVAALLGGIALFLGMGAGTPGADPADRTLVALGQDVYRANCAQCHGAALEGQANWRLRNPDGTFPAPPHDETGHTWHHPDRFLFDYTKQGGGALAPPGFRSAMPGFAGTLEDREIWAVLAFIKSRWPEPVLARQRAIDKRAR